MAYTTIDDPSAYFQTTLWTGNASARSITFDGNSDMQPDWVWIKNRASTQNHRLFDSVRGAGKNIKSNDTQAQIDAGTGTDGQLRSFASDGFTLGTDGSVNNNNEGHVAWSWKAGTSFSNDASSTSVGSIDSTASVSQTAGFSIVKYTGTGSNETVAHGLGLAPEIMFCKNLSAAENWVVYVKSLGNTKRLVLDTTGAVGTDATIFNSTTPNTTVFGIGENAGANGNGHGQIAYCFASVKGYSKIGTYVGNGNADGPFVYTGFKPAFIIVKNTASGGWQLRDHKRTIFNMLTNLNYANATSVEQTTDGIDFLSNGWKLRNSAGDNNADGVSYIYLAIAKNPLVTSTGIPGLAR